jgi:hypothetical protein
MQPEDQRVYLSELRAQCSAVMLAANDLEHLLDNAFTAGLFGGQSEHKVRFWYALQSFLTAAANISKLLWPIETRGRSKEDKILADWRLERGRDLRQLLTVPDDSPLRSRTFRDHVEHFDERLDQWVHDAQATEDRLLLVRFIAPGMAPEYRPTPERCFLYFDAEDYTVTFRGERYELVRVAQVIHALGEQIDALLAAPNHSLPE